MPLSIHFVNMPFSGLTRPSIALTQLKDVTQRVHGENVTTRLTYCNHDFGRVLSEEIYTYASDSDIARYTGLGEWFFRATAFPEVPDNREEYWSRFSHHFHEDGRRWFTEVLCPFRARLPEFLDELIAKYELHKADIVGLTSMFWQNLACVSLANRLRKTNPKQIIVMGGANCEGTMGIEFAANFPVIDFVFSGPSLISFPKFVGHVLQQDLEACHHLDGVFSTRNSRSVLSVKEGTEVKPADLLNGVGLLGPELDINTPIELDYDGFFDSYESNVPAARGFFNNIELFFETSRGCWWGERAHCTFCGLNGATMTYRAMQPALALQVIEKLVAKYGPRAGRRLVLMSVDNILPREYFDTVFAKLRVPPNVSLFYEVKADLTGEQIEQLGKSGVRFIQPGIESLATSTLKLMRKGTTSFGNIRFLVNCEKHSVHAFWNLLLGSPGETAETYNTYYERLPLLYHLQPPIGAFQIRFDRFSPYFNKPEQYGLKLRPYDFYGIAYVLPEQVLTRIAYYFENANADAQYFIDVAMALTKLQKIVERWRSRWAGGAGTQPRLELRERGDRYFVIDSRRGAVLNVPVSKVELQVLQAAVKPREESEMIAEYGGAFQSVMRKGFLFKERGRVMNVVMNLPAEEEHSAQRLADIPVVRMTV